MGDRLKDQNRIISELTDPSGYESVNLDDMRNELSPVHECQIRPCRRIIMFRYPLEPTKKT